MYNLPPKPDLVAEICVWNNIMKKYLFIFLGLIFSIKTNAQIESVNNGNNCTFFPITQIPTSWGDNNNKASFIEATVCSSYSTANYQVEYCNNLQIFKDYLYDGTSEVEGGFFIPFTFAYKIDYAQILSFEQWNYCKQISFYYNRNLYSFVYSEYLLEITNIETGEVIANIPLNSNTFSINMFSYSGGRYTLMINDSGNINIYTLDDVISSVSNLKSDRKVNYKSYNMKGQEVSKNSKGIIIGTNQDGNKVKYYKK